MDYSEAGSAEKRAAVPFRPTPFFPSAGDGRRRPESRYPGGSDCCRAARNRGESSFGRHPEKEPVGLGSGLHSTRSTETSA